MAKTAKKTPAKKATAKKAAATPVKDYGHGDLSWFKHDRFGMFIHWGLYSMPARHEWIKRNEAHTDEWYQTYFDLFDPDMFEPQLWAKAAKAAGMKYMVITTKHHEGFCLWDTKYTDYKAPNTPAGKDLLREIVDAFRAEGIRIGFYYSLLDWHHPHFTADCYHPLCNRKGVTKEEIAEFNKGRDMKIYAKYMRDQVTELLTEYGKIDVIWFDFSYAAYNENGKGCKDWESEKLIKLVRKLQPDIIVDNRLDLPGSGDIVTPEQYTPPAEMTDENGRPVAWEGCQTFSGSWGYHRDETSWKSAKQCIELLINHVARNGNLLMNVGPTSRGYLDKRAMERLNDYAEWMKYHNRAIYGCGAAPAEIPQADGARFTYNPKTNRLYVHILDWPFCEQFLPKMAGKFKYAQFLHDGSELAVWERNGDAIIRLPVNKPDVIVPVVELFFK